jgi:hypothetical protein
MPQGVWSIYYSRLSAFIQSVFAANSTLVNQSVSRTEDRGPFYESRKEVIA